MVDRTGFYQDENGFLDEFEQRFTIAVFFDQTRPETPVLRRFFLKVEAPFWLPSFVLREKANVRFDSKKKLKKRNFSDCVLRIGFPIEDRKQGLSFASGIVRRRLICVGLVGGQNERSMPSSRVGRKDVGIRDRSSNVEMIRKNGISRRKRSDHRHRNDEVRRTSTTGAASTRKSRGPSLKFDLRTNDVLESQRILCLRRRTKTRRTAAAGDRHSTDVFSFWKKKLNVDWNSLLFDCRRSTICLTSTELWRFFLFATKDFLDLNQRRLFNYSINSFRARKAEFCASRFSLSLLRRKFNFSSLTKRRADWLNWRFLYLTFQLVERSGNFCQKTFSHRSIRTEFDAAIFH